VKQIATSPVFYCSNADLAGRVLLDISEIPVHDDKLPHAIAAQTQVVPGRPLPDGPSEWRKYDLIQRGIDIPPAICWFPPCVAADECEQLA
jgi:hypothetical protein